MKVDRYTRIVLTAIALALSTLAIKDIVAPQPAVAAAPAMGEGRYQLVIGLCSVRWQIRMEMETGMHSSRLETSSLTFIYRSEFIRVTIRIPRFHIEAFQVPDTCTNGQGTNEPASQCQRACGASWPTAQHLSGI